MGLTLILGIALLPGEAFGAFYANYEIFWPQSNPDLRVFAAVNPRQLGPFAAVSRDRYRDLRVSGAYGCLQTTAGNLVAPP